MAVSRACYVGNFKMIGQLIKKVLCKGDLMRVELWKAIIYHYSPHVSVFFGGIFQQLVWCCCRWRVLNTLRPRQNGRHFPDDIFKCIFFNANIWISLKISLKFVPEFCINNIAALVQIMAWRQISNKSISEPKVTQINGAHMRHPASMS